MKLRHFTIEDASEVARLLGDESVSKWTTQIPFPYTEQDAVDWIRRTAVSHDRHPFAVEVDGAIVGCVSYWSHGDGTLEVGYWIGRSYWGRGFCTQALSRLMAQDFFPGHCDVMAKVMKGNSGSEKVLLKCGFAFAGNCIVEKAGQPIQSKLFVKRAASA